MRDIVEQAMRGDRDSFAWLVTLTSDRMFAIATPILRDTHLAEDALQSRPGHGLARAASRSGLDGGTGCGEAGRAGDGPPHTQPQSDEIPGLRVEPLEETRASNGDRACDLANSSETG